MQGVVQSLEGHPIPGAAVTVLAVAGGQVGQGVSAGNGSYRIAIPGPGQYVLIARAGGHQPYAEMVNVVTRLAYRNVELSGAARLRGTIRGQGGEPVTRARLIVTDIRGMVIASTSVNAEGNYLLEGLVGGACTATIIAPGVEPLALPLDLPDTGTTTLDAELTGPAEVHGVVRSARGGQRPLPAIRVTLVAADGSTQAVALTNQAGEYRFRDVPDGQYTLVATGYPPAVTSVRLTTAADHRQDIAMGYDDI